MTAYDRLILRMRNGERILIDGATGTEIEKRGVPQLDNAWNGGGALSHPEILLQVHEDYIRAGAEVVISNTFATTMHALEDAGVAQDFEAYNRRGVEIAKEAIANCGTPDVMAAGGMSYWSWSGRHPSLKDLSRHAARQAEIMAEAGADLLMMEMMVDHDRMLAVLDPALAAGLPVWVGLSCKPNSEGEMCLENGDPIAPALAALAERDIPLVSIMHTEVEYVSDCLDILSEHWRGLVGVYAHSARWVGQKTVFEGAISAEAYADQARGWLDRGVQVIGGCCGLGVDHIEALRPLVER